MEEANGLRLIELGSEVNPIEGIDDAGDESLRAMVGDAFPQQAFVTAFMHHAVRIGTWRTGRFHFHDESDLPLKHVVKLRVFHPDAELFIWKARHGFKGRLRRDDRRGKGTHVVEAVQVLFGTKIAESPGEGYATVTEDRGTTLVLPFDNIRVDDNKRRVFIKTRHYVAYGQNHQATYDDCRFAGFCDVNGDLR